MPQQQKPRNAALRYLLKRLSERSTWAAIGTLLGASMLGWLDVDQVKVFVEYMPELVTAVAALVGIMIVPTSGGKS